MNGAPSFKGFRLSFSPFSGWKSHLNGTASVFYARPGGLMEKHLVVLVHPYFCPCCNCSQWETEPIFRTDNRTGTEKTLNLLRLYLTVAWAGYVFLEYGYCVDFRFFVLIELKLFEINTNKIFIMNWFKNIFWERLIFNILIGIVFSMKRYNKIMILSMKKIINLKKLSIIYIFINWRYIYLFIKKK